MILQSLCNVFKLNLLKGLEDFDPASSSNYKIALYDSFANLTADTTQYTTEHEVTGGGYTAGGQTLTKVAPSLSGSTAIVTFGNVTWNPATFSARCALIYNSTTNAAVAVLDFGATKTASGTFTITFPAANASSAIIRIS
jgi:anaerobic selenocysteine-containing dehydrogenase